MANQSPVNQPYASTDGLDQRLKKILAWALTVVSALLLLLGLINFKQTIANPYAEEQLAGGSNESPADNNLPSDPTQLSVAQIEQLSKQDTDNDGLSDYDELYRYKTSPYIADTDSDNISDGAEVKAGTDPLCPAGKSCFAMPTPAATEQTDLGTEALPDLRNLTAAEIRQLLILSGTPSPEVAKMTDQQLLDNYRNAYDQLASLQATSTGLPNDLTKATPEQIKAFLKSQGATDEQLKSYTDDELKKVFLEALSALSGTPKQ